MSPYNSFVAAYYEMLRIRNIEETIAARYSDQEMRCPVHLSIGQEAVPVAVCAALEKSDYAMSSHRSHAHYLAKGGSLPKMIAEIYGKETGCCRGKGGSMHLIDREVGFLGATPIVGSTIPIGVGAAMGSAMAGENRVTAVFFGDGAAEEGVFHESLNFAVLKTLPVVFVCENNLYSVYSHLHVRQSEKRQLVEIARGHGLPSEQADGNDYQQVAKLSKEAVDRARSKGGPTFLELITYRWREHCGPNFDNNIGYRTENEFLAWKEKCPVNRLEQLLKRSGELTDAVVKQMQLRIETEIQEALTFAQQSPFPAKTTLTNFIYAE
jgi:pyruvate dehydrogenase E1 component alpha subunit